MLSKQPVQTHLRRPMMHASGPGRNPCQIEAEVGWLVGAWTRARVSQTVGGAQGPEMLTAGGID